MSGLRAHRQRMGELDGGLGAVVVVTEGFIADVPRGARAPAAGSAGPRARGGRFARAALRVRSRRRPRGRRSRPGRDDRRLGRRTVALRERWRGRPAATRSWQARISPPALQRVSRDLDGYYVITYRTTAKPTTGVSTPCRSRTTRRDTQVRARSGYWAPLPTSTCARTRDRDAGASCRCAPMRRSPLIESWFGPDDRSRRHAAA